MAGTRGGVTHIKGPGRYEKRGSKYKAKGQWVDGIYFPSKAEAARWLQLLDLERSGEIDKLERQPAYPIKINNKLICKYIADFRYDVVDDRGAVLRHVVEDVKGMMTPIYKLKRKMVVASYGFEIIEIPARDIEKWAGRIP